jgi:hypothetical protein
VLPVTSLDGVHGHCPLMWHFEGLETYMCLEACRKREDQGAVIVFARMNPETAFVCVSHAQGEGGGCVIRHYVVKI